MSVFLQLSKVVIEEVVAGRLPVHEAKAQLRANAEVAFKREVNARCELLLRRKVFAWDNPAEEIVLKSVGQEQ